MLEILFTQDFEYEDLFCGTPFSSDSACSSATISSAWILSLFKMTFIPQINELFEFPSFFCLESACHIWVPQLLKIKYQSRLVCSDEL